jgi:arylsulfatase A-like enzyme
MDKRWMYEESLRMPFLVRYPGELDPGTVVDDIIINADFAPFLIDIAGINIPYDMQGRSFLANLYGDTPDDWRQSMYYRYWLHTEGRPAHYGVRTQNHKLIFFYGLPLGKTGTYSVPTTPGWELYDLKNDPYELQNVYQDPRYRNVVTTLKNELLRLKKELGDEDSRYPEMVRMLGSMNN